MLLKSLRINRLLCILLSKSCCCLGVKKNEEFHEKAVRYYVTNVGAQREILDLILATIAELCCCTFRFKLEHFLNLFVICAAFKVRNTNSAISE